MLSRMRRVLDVDLANRCLIVEPGVTNVEVGKAAVAPSGFHYAPDPSSQSACSSAATSPRTPAGRTASSTA